MNKFLIAIAVALLLTGSSVFAQKTKYAFIQNDSILIKMPEMQAADKELNEFVAQLQNEITKMQTEYETKVKDYEANKANLSGIVLENKVAEINELGKRIQEFQVKAQEEIIKKREDLYQPVADKFNNAIEEVAKKKGYSAVFPANSAIYFNPKDDITELVKEKLGIE